MKKLLKKIFLIISIQGVAKVFNLFSRFAMVRILSVSDYGYYALLISWVQLGSRFMIAGTDKLMVKEIGAASDKYDDHVKGLVKWGFMVFSLISLMATIIGLVLIQSDIMNPTFTKIAPYFITLSIIYGFYMIHEAVLQGLDKSVTSRLVQFLVLPSLILLAMVTIYLNSNHLLDFQNFMMVILIVNGISMIVAAWLIYSNFFKQLGEKIANYDLKASWKKYSLNILLITMIQISFQKLDILLLGYLESAESVAIYSIPVTLIQATSMILVGFNIIMEPKISSFYANKRINNLVPTIQQNTRIQTAIMLGISISCIFYGTNLLAYFGDTYSAGGQMLIILSFVPVVLAASGPLLVVLRMTGHVVEINIAFISSLIFHLIISYLLIKGYGSVGAAWAVLLSVLQLRVQLLIRMKRKLGFSTLIFT